MENEYLCELRITQEITANLKARSLEDAQRLIVHDKAQVNQVDSTDPDISILSIRPIIQDLPQ